MDFLNDAITEIEQTISSASELKIFVWKTRLSEKAKKPFRRLSTLKFTHRFQEEVLKKGVFVPKSQKNSTKTDFLHSANGLTPLRI